MKMKIKDFYTLSSKLSSTTFQAHLISKPKSESNSQWRLIAGEYNCDHPIIFKHVYGKKLEDILDTGWPSLYLISDKMKNILEQENLTGWKTFIIQVLDKSGQEIKGYHGLSITGKCGSIDFSQCELIEKQLIYEGPISKYYKGLYIGLDKWDGSDLFLPEGTFQIITTQKAMDAFKKNKLTNIKFENLVDVETLVLTYSND